MNLAPIGFSAQEARRQGGHALHQGATNYLRWQLAQVRALQALNGSEEMAGGDGKR
jgi:hypothetical protein